FLIIGSFHAHGYGLGDWEHQTPSGNMMRDNGSGITLTLNGKREDISIKKWYFYKNHIIGFSNNSFFIVNETKKEIYTFKTEEDWHDAIGQHNLKPWIWTRWYVDNWVEMDAILTIILFLFLGFFIVMIPLTMLFFWILFKAITEENCRPSKPNTAFLLSIFFLLFMRIMLDSFPQSF
ncbi:MAG: hypothetical protein RL757_3356, partial [Bacteroidota bacterium]